MLKPKKKKCKNPDCKKEFQPWSTTQKACSLDCAKVVGRREQEARKKREAREWRAETRRRKEKAKTLKEVIDDAQKVINRLVVLEDGPKGCISCLEGQVSDAGHYFHRGSKYRTSWLTLSRINLNGQCRHCNSFKGGGNQHEYRAGFIERYGRKRFDELVELKRKADSGELPTPTIEEVKRFIAATKAEYKQRLKELRG